MRRTLLILCLLFIAGCSPHYTYHFVEPDDANGIPSDSLKWKYVGGVVTEITVRAKNGEVMRLSIDEETILYVLTTEKDVLHFRFPTITVEDRGQGLLGSNTVWRGYDNRQ